MEFTLNDKTQSDIVLYILLLNKINSLAPREKTRFRSENRKQLDFLIASRTGKCGFWSQ